MWRTVRSVLICLTLGGCATSSSMSSSTPSLGGTEAAQPKSTASQAAQDDSSGSGLGGIWGNFSSAFSSGAQPASQKTTQTAFGQGLDPDEALRLINEYRTAKGVGPLSLDPQATHAAEVLAKDMAAHDRMSHTGPGKQDVGKRLLAAGYNFSVASENVGVGQTTVEETVNGWKASKANSRNMLLANAAHIGIAYESRPSSQHKTFWVLVVAAP
jgi:uncharacterized protein YkwD